MTVFTGRHALIATVGALLATTALAQGVYRIVGPDGRVTFSDQPPPAATPVRPAAATGAAPTGGGAGLPFELQRVASRYPVLLYTAAECPPCNSGRNYLVGRGIPFSEKTVTSAEDIAAFQRIAGGDTGLPLLTIGTQQLKGFSEVEWAQYLNAAGYPARITLPSSYRRPAAEPLVAVSRPAAPAATGDAPPAGSPARPRGASAASTEPAPIPVEPPVTNPAGIRF
jgi:glutaredoxin